MEYAVSSASLAGAMRASLEFRRKMCNSLTCHETSRCAAGNTPVGGGIHKPREAESRRCGLATCIGTIAAIVPRNHIMHVLVVRGNSSVRNQAARPASRHLGTAFIASISALATTLTAAPLPASAQSPYYFWDDAAPRSSYKPYRQRSSSAQARHSGEQRGGAGRARPSRKSPRGPSPRRTNPATRPRSSRC